MATDNKGSLIKLTLLLPPELYAKLKALAKDCDVPLGQFVGMSLNAVAQSADTLQSNQPSKSKILN